MTTRVMLVDYGVGNIHSVAKALAHEGADVVVTSDPAALRDASRLVLPGVGAFADGVNGLEARGLVEPLRAHLAADKPFLGICLGMQLLLAESHEFGVHRGLGFIPGSVEPIPKDLGLKVPHVGWNRIVPAPGASWRGTPLEDLDEAETMVYFVHSFNARPEREAHRLADAAYGNLRVCAAVAAGNVVGVQFHPEKSGTVGLRIIRRFLER